MSTPAVAFRELMGDDFVEIDALRALAWNGVPQEVRGEVWKYLIASQCDVSDALAEESPGAHEPAGARVSKRLRGELRRYCTARAEFGMEAQQDRMEAMLTRYIASQPDREYQPHQVHILGPLAACMADDDLCYECFQVLMAHAVDPPERQVKAGVARVMMLVRARAPDLAHHFEEEELEPSEWLPQWLRFLLSAELPLPCVLRLWDTYLSAPEGFALHPYVCAAVLQVCQEDLIELEYPEMKGFLQHLPWLDVEQVLSVALALWAEEEGRHGASAAPPAAAAATSVSAAAASAAPSQWGQ